MPNPLPIRQLLTVVGASFGRGPISRRESREIVGLATRPLSSITGYRLYGWDWRDVAASDGTKAVRPPYGRQAHHCETPKGIGLAAEDGKLGMIHDHSHAG
jgi:hypothetical protein